MIPPPIVAFAGDDDARRAIHEYEQRCRLARALEDEIHEAEEWNRRERFVVGIFANDHKPPVSVFERRERFSRLCRELHAERDAITARWQTWTRLGAAPDVAEPAPATPDRATSPTPPDEE